MFLYGRHQEELEDALHDIEITGRKAHGAVAGQKQQVAQGTMLMAGNIARMVVWSLCQPKLCDIVEFKVHPRKQFI